MTATTFQFSARLFAVLALFLVPITNSVVHAASYDETVDGWTSYQDVSKWLDRYFDFDEDRFNTVIERTRKSGPPGLLAKSAAGTFSTRTGYCADAANFAIHSLNTVNPSYYARYIFIKNQYGQPHHWVAGFMVKGKIMVMDYGANPHWRGMRGVLGPYESLDQYADFLRSLQIPHFTPERVEWEDVFPGQED